MGIVSGEPVSVSLRDSDASRDELEALRDVMRRDAPFPDEPPTLEEAYEPSEEDDRWWAAQCCDPFADRSPFDRWEDLDLEPLPEPGSTAYCNDRGGFFGWPEGTDFS